MRLTSISLSALALLVLSGCASISRGVTQAFLTPSENEVRSCRVEGEPFAGLYSILEYASADPQTDRKTMRMLIVHGIGAHAENYSKPFVDQIAEKMGLNRRDPEQKRINLGTAVGTFAGVYPGPELGSMLISRRVNNDATRELLVFEVNWSEYHAEVRKTLVESDSNIDRDRAGVNNQVKRFFNQQVVDPIKYIGDTAPKIRAHVRQASCWMVSADWDEYPDSERIDRTGEKPREICYALDPNIKTSRSMVDIIRDDSFVAVTHSLGSRIFLDAFTIPDADIDDYRVNPFVSRQQAFANKKISVFMLTNQLPLLQLGVPEAGATANRLKPGAPATTFIPWENSKRYSAEFEEFGLGAYANRDELCKNQEARRFSELAMITVSDPNDILSYKLTETFKDDYIDWSLCPRFTDVTIEVTPPRSVLGLNFADPGSAHGNYWTDQGLASILINGLGEQQFLRDGKDNDAGRSTISVTERGREIQYQCRKIQNDRR